MRKLWTAMVIFLWLSSAWLFAGTSKAEPPDPHLASPRTSSVVRQSTFLHGYLHGYEDGYSAADMDLQMARGPRDPEGVLKEAHNVTAYRAEFGARPAFEAGYHEGFRVGYADSIAGRVFRAVDLIQQVMEAPVNLVAAAEPAPEPVAPQPRVPRASALFEEVAKPARAVSPPEPHKQVLRDPANPFDEGFANGYSSGQRRGLADARSAIPFATPNAVCPSGFSKATSAPESCAGYLRGFAMGYSDGYVNVAQPATATAAQSK